MKNSVHPDQLASQKPADLDLHCFQNGITRICIVMVNFALVLKEKNALQSSPFYIKLTCSIPIIDMHLQAK